MMSMLIIHEIVKDKFAKLVNLQKIGGFPPKRTRPPIILF